MYQACINVVCPDRAICRGSGVRPGLSEPADPADCAVRSRRFHRYGSAHPRAAPDPADGAERDCRQPYRRRRHHRRGYGRARRARRLYAAGWRLRPERRGGGVVLFAPLRSNHELYAYLARGEFPAGTGGARLVAAQRTQGLPRARADPAKRTALWQRGRRHVTACVHGTAAKSCQDRNHARAVQGRRAGGCRCDGR